MLFNVKLMSVPKGRLQFGSTLEQHKGFASKLI